MKVLPVMSANLRISCGKHKNKKTIIDLAQVTRPAQALVRESLFNWLKHDLSGKRCLDLFAGTGILAWEALSCGASSATLVEQNPLACRMLNNQAEEFGYSRKEVRVLRRDVYRWLQNEPGDQFDLIFIDPPYATDYFAKCLPLLLKNKLLAPKGHVFYEIDKRTYSAFPWLNSGEEICIADKEFRSIKQNNRGATYFGLISEI